MISPEEQIFNETTRERKSCVAGARHRKNGSKSKRCVLSTDHMTRKEWEKMNSPVTTFAMNMPCTIDMLYEQSLDIQCEYIERLRNVVCLTDGEIANMLHIGIPRLSKFLKNRGIAKRSTNYKRTREDREIAQEFLKKGEPVEPSKPAENSKEVTVDLPAVMANSIEETAADTIQPMVMDADTENIIAASESVSTDMLDALFSMEAFKLNEDRLKASLFSGDVRKNLPNIISMILKIAEKHPDEICDIKFERHKYKRPR